MEHTIRTLRSDEIDAIEPIARDFFAEAKYPGEFAFETFKSFWEPIINQGFGEVFVALLGGQIVGLIGAIFSPSLFNGELTALIHFWYARSEVRGKTRVGISLFRQMMQEAKRRECSAVMAGHILTINEDGFQTFFEREGFTLREKVYRKELK